MESARKDEQESTTRSESPTLTPFALEDVADGKYRTDLQRILLRFQEKYVVENKDGSKTFVGVSNDEAQNSFIARIIDMLDDQVVGETSFGYFGPGTRPSIMSTYTANEHLKQGFGRRRAVIANEICKKRTGMNLHSSMARRPAADAFWQRLVEQNLAQVPIDTTGKKIYSML